MKYFNFKRYKFFPKINTYYIKTFISNKIKKYLQFKLYNFNKLPKYFYSSISDSFKVFRRFTDKKLKYLSYYLLGFFIFVIFTYLSLPFFYTFNKSNIQNAICQKTKLKCIIESNISYSFFPSPRIKFDNFLVKDIVNNNKNLAKITNVEVMIPIFNLHNKSKFGFNKVKFKDSIIDFNLENLQEYKNFFTKKLYSNKIIFKGGSISFSDGKKFVTSIKKINLKYIKTKNKTKVIFKGKIIDESIYVNYKENNNKEKKPKNFIFKLDKLGFLAKIDMFGDQLKTKKLITGNALLKQDKNKITALFDYKDDRIFIKHSNLRTAFLDGKSDGEIILLPYFDFNLNFNLNSVNFNKLVSSLISLSKEEKRKLFRINKKINGTANISINKIFSRHTLIHALESELRFINGNIILERVLLDLGKIGAADLSGAVKNGKNFSNFQFDSNIFIDNLKKLFSKFGIYNEKKIPHSLFVSGSFDLQNLLMRINEITGEEKFKEADLSYIQSEFNQILLENGYASLFNFKNLKTFFKSINIDQK